MVKFRFALPTGMLLQSETKTEPDLDHVTLKPQRLSQMLLRLLVLVTGLSGVQFGL